MKTTTCLQRPAAVGLTGGMGSGKSSVGRFWQQRYGIEYIDADRVCRELLQPQAAGWQALTGEFDDLFLAADRTVDRPLLRRAIFGDATLRQRLNDLIHPLARQEIRRRISAAAAPGFLVEVPLLFEAGWAGEFDRTVVVYALPSLCRDRLMARDGIDAAEAIRAIAVQFPLDNKALLADHVIDNSGTWQDTCLQLLHLGEMIWGGAKL